MRNTYKYNASFPDNIEKNGERENDFRNITDSFNQIDWELAFKKFDASMEEGNHEAPHFHIENLDNEYVLDFTLARNEALETKILMFLSYPEKKVRTSFFGLIKKEVEVKGGMGVLIENEDAIKTLEAFERKDYKFIEAFDEHKRLR